MIHVPIPRCSWERLEMVWAIAEHSRERLEMFGAIAERSWKRLEGPPIGEARRVSGPRVLLRDALQIAAGVERW